MRFQVLGVFGIWDENQESSMSVERDTHKFQ